MYRDGSEIVDAVGLIGVLMGQKYRVEMIDIRVDQLLPQIGVLLLFTLVLFPISLACFHLAVRSTKRSGTLAQY